MTVNFAEFYDYIEHEFRNSRDFDLSIQAMYEWLEQHVPHKDWARVSALNAKGDLQIAKDWLLQLLRRESCPFTPRGILFNILDVFGEEDDYGGYGPNHADLCPVFFPDYDAGDESLQWIYGDERFDIDDSNAKLPTLKEAGLLINGSDGGLGSEAYIAHSVGYVLLLLRHMLDGVHFELLKAEESVGIVAGFASGDLFSLGELTKAGFIIRSKPFLTIIEA